MAEKAGFEGEGEVEFRSPGKIRDERDEGFQETCRTCQDSNKTPKRHARDNEICVRPRVSIILNQWQIRNLSADPVTSLFQTGSHCLHWFDWEIYPVFDVYD